MAIGVGEVAVLIKLAVYAMATSIVLLTAESQLRVKAAGQQKTVEGSREQTTKGGTALAGAVVQTGLLIFFEGARVVTIKYMPSFIKGAKEMTSSLRERIASLLDKDRFAPEMRTQILSDIATQRTALMEMAANAKTELVSKAQLLDGLTAEDFVTKLEAGDKGLIELTGITEDKVPVYRQLLGTTEGKSAIGSMIKSLHDGLMNEGSGIIEQTIKPFIDDLNAFENDINNAKTVDEARTATTKYESTLNEESLTQRVKAQQDQAVQEYIKKAQEKLKEQQEQAEIEDLQNKMEAQGKSVTIDGITIPDVNAAIMVIKDHVLRIQSIRKYKGSSGFTGCHSIIALDDYVSNHSGSTWIIKNKTPGRGGVYEGEPQIHNSDGTIYGKINNRGVSTFFPDKWTEPKILVEVEYAIRNCIGKIPATKNTYHGFSSDGAIEIYFYINPDGSFGSFFPKK